MRKNALQEKRQLERAKSEAKFRVEEAKQAALEADTEATMEAKRKAEMEVEKRAAAEAKRRAEKEAIERNVADTSKRVTSVGVQREAVGVPLDTTSSVSNSEAKESGIVYQAAASALNLEHGRLQKMNELCERNQMIRSSYNKDYERHLRHIRRITGQISGILDNVRPKASELIKLLNDLQCPQSISIEVIAKKQCILGQLGNNLSVLIQG